MNLQRYSTFWITGASDGIGKALALSLASINKNLILSSRNKEKLQKVQKRCIEIAEASKAETKANISIEVLDCHNIAQCKALSNILADKVDVAIFAAGLSQRALTFTMEEASDAQIFSVNFLAPIEITKVLIQTWKQQVANSGSSSADSQNLAKKKIVLLSSVAGHLPVPLRAMYGASKRALEHYCETLYNELLQQRIAHIDILSIIPGYVRTNISKHAILGNQERWGQMDKNQAKGLAVETAARQILKAIHTKRRYKVKYIGLKLELYIILAMYRIFPSLANMLLRQANTAQKE